MIEKSCVPKTACKDCPYRKDAPVRKWAVEHFIEVLESETAQYGLGNVFMCHQYKDITSFCGGWLLSQKVRNIPSLTLKMFLCRWDSQAMLNFLKLRKPRNVEMFSDPIEMIAENYPEIIKFKSILKNEKPI